MRKAHKFKFSSRNQIIFLIYSMPSIFKFIYCNSFYQSGFIFRRYRAQLLCTQS